MLRCPCVVPFPTGSAEDESSVVGEAKISGINWLERDRWSTVPGSPRTVGVAAQASGAVTPVAARFERNDGDLVLAVTIRAHEAEHGALISVPAPGAPVRLRVPPGTMTGRLFRVPRSNAPAPDGFGDLVVRIDVV